MLKIFSMRQLKLVVVFVALFFLALPARAGGRLVTVVGKVLITSTSATQPPKDAQSGDVVTDGSILVTSSDGAAKLLLDDGTIVDIAKSTSFKVEKVALKNLDDRDVDLELSYGKVRTLVNKPLRGAGRFRIRTKTAVLGVRGTELLVEASDTGSQPTKLTVVHGQVEFSDGKAASVMVPAGMTIGLDSAGLKQAAPVPMAPAAMDSAVKLAKLEDSTFKEALITPADSNKAMSAERGALALAFSKAQIPAVEGFQPKASDAAVKGVFGHGQIPDATNIPPVFQGGGGGSSVTIIFQ